MLKSNEHGCDPVNTETTKCSEELATNSAIDYTKSVNLPMCLKLNSCGMVSHVMNTSSHVDSSRHGVCESSNENELKKKHKNMNGSNLQEKCLNNMEKESSGISSNLKPEMSVTKSLEVAEELLMDQTEDNRPVTETRESDSDISESSDNSPVPGKPAENSDTCKYEIVMNQFSDEDYESDSKISENSSHSPRKKYCLRKTRKTKMRVLKRSNVKTKHRIDVIADKLSNRTSGSNLISGSNRPLGSNRASGLGQRSGLEEETRLPNSKGKNNKKRKKKRQSQTETNFSDTSCEIQREDKKRYQCHVCGKCLKSSSAVNVHQRIHTGEKPFACTICNKSFSVKESLNRHIRTHTGEKPYVCSFCGESFGQAASLKRHMGRHTGNYPFKCHMCDKRYIQHSDLISHLRSHEGLKREKMWICEVCGSGFVSTRNLIRHVKWVHIADKPFVCDVCGKGFIELAKLSAHQRYHTGERPFRCAVCDRGFVDKSYLREHMKLHEDKGKKTYNCKMCEKNFASSKSLYRHVRTIHTKEEVYTCNICWKSFGQSGNLKIHHLRHHKSEYIKPGSKGDKDDDDEEEDDVYEQYILQQNKILEKSSHGDSGGVESSTENQKLKGFENISREDILRKFGRQKAQTSSAESVAERDNEKK